MNRIAKFFLKSNTGRLILGGLVLVGIGYGVRLYLVDLPALQEESQRGEGSERLEDVAERLEGFSDAERQAIERTPWYPNPLPCGTTRAFGEPTDPIFTTLGFEPDHETAFQYRLDRADGDIRVIARRDSDCDGFYAVWTLDDGMMTAQNTQE